MLKASEPMPLDYRFHHGEGDGCGDGGVDRVAAVGQHPKTRAASEDLWRATFVARMGMRGQKA